MRSFDRIALTQEIIDQVHESGIDATKADIALDLDLNGDSIQSQSVVISSAANGDALDHVAHQSGKTAKTSMVSKVGDIFAWNSATSTEGKHRKVNQILSSFERSMTESRVSPSIAQHGMMTGSQVSDQYWRGDDQAEVKNFITEELYIHTKVYLIMLLLNIAYDRRRFL